MSPLKQILLTLAGIALVYGLVGAEHNGIFHFDDTGHLRPGPTPTATRH